MSNTHFFRRPAVLVLAMLALPVATIFTPARRALGGNNLWTWFEAITEAGALVSTVSDPGWIYLLTSNSTGLVRSNDGGLTWSPATLPPYPLISNPEPVPNHAERLIVYTSIPESSSDRQRFVSLDAGSTWQTMPTSPSTLGVSHIDPREMYTTQGGDFMVSTDAGATWTATGTIPEACTCTTEYDCQPNDVVDIASAPSTPAIIVMRLYTGNASEHKLCKSSDRGATWARLPVPTMATASFTFDPKNSNTMYVAAGAGGGGWKTTDGGLTWRPMANGLVAPLEFVIDPQNTQVVYARAEGAAMESTDGGQVGTPSMPASPA